MISNLLRSLLLSSLARRVERAITLAVSGTFRWLFQAHCDGRFRHIAMAVPGTLRWSFQADCGSCFCHIAMMVLSTLQWSFQAHTMVFSITPRWSFQTHCYGC